MNDWKEDERGYRYRDTGEGIREYAAQITTTRGTYDEDRLPKLPVAKIGYYSGKESDIQRSPQAGQSCGVICPLKAFKGGMYRFCDGGCAFYDAGGCSFSGRTTAAQQDTVGRDCPIVGRCTVDCALHHDDGCVLRR